MTDKPYPVRTGQHQEVATAPEVLAAQYGSGSILRSRVAIYDYLESDTKVVARLDEWVLDHVCWTGSMTVADVGCGPGPYLSELSTRAAAVIALDSSIGMLRDARNGVFASTLPSVVVADAQRLPLDDDSVDVVLAAHMLYHVADIEAAIAEFRRILRSEGTLLVPLNGAHDKAEIRAMWQEAAAAVAGSAFEPPDWGTRANLDNVPQMLAPYFSSVEVDRLPGTFKFPTAEPALIWMDSLRPGTEGLIGDREWEAITAETRTRIENVIAQEGVFRVCKESGVVIAR